MMKQAPLLVLAIFMLVSTGCQNSGNYDIQGTIEFDSGQPASGSDVYLDDVFRTTTDQNGAFEIRAVDAGSHLLKATNGDSSGYSEFETEIQVEKGNLDLNDLRLPVPVKMPDPVEVTSNSITLVWNRCRASDFREYKIYMHHSGALDERTGTLLHVATDVNDTILEISAGDYWWGGSTITPGTTYFFRVFVMNSFGRLSGSNVLEVTTGVWDHAEQFTSNYRITLESAFSAQGRLTGIDWDGEFFWMLYFEENGGFQENNRISLVQYDHIQGVNLDTLVFDDSNYFSEGLAWDGRDLWISLSSYIQRVDLENRSLGKTYYAGDAIVDLAHAWKSLVLLDVWNKAFVLDPANGMITNQFTTPFDELGYSGEKGVAAREGEIWIINNWHNEIAIVDYNGNHIGVAEVDFLQEGFTANYHRIPMCFMGEKLVIALDSQVRIYTLESLD